MSDPRKEDVTRSTTESLDGILKGEILTRISREISPKIIEEITVRARRRFAQNALWTIGIMEIKPADRKIFEEFKTSFDEFRKAGGALIIIITHDPVIIKALRTAAMNAGNVPIKIAGNLKECNEISSQHRAKHKNS